MRLGDFRDPEFLRFYNEASEQIALLRVRWNEKNWERVQQAAILGREDKRITDLDVTKIAMVGGLAAISRDHVSGARHRFVVQPSGCETVSIPLRKGHSIPEIGLGDPIEDPRLARPDSDLTPDPLMRPVDPQQKEILHKSRPEYGRAVYIKNRNRMAPEDKYYFPETTSWLYGWRLKDSCSMVPRGPRYPLGSIIMRSGCRSGPQPDPYYYKDPDALMHGPNKCVL